MRNVVSSCIEFVHANASHVRCTPLDAFTCQCAILVDERNRGLAIGRAAEKQLTYCKVIRTLRLRLQAIPRLEKEREKASCWQRTGVRAARRMVRDRLFQSTLRTSHLVRG